MESVKLTLKLLKRSSREVKGFFIIMISIVALIFNYINLINIEGSGYSTVGERVVMYGLMIVVLTLSIIVIVYGNTFINEGRGKEIGIEILSGLSVYRLGVHVTLYTGILTFGAFILGAFLGIIISPIFNCLMGAKNIFDVSLEGMLYTFLIFLLQIITLSLVNQGFGYRNEITTLLGLKEKSTYIQNRYKDKGGSRVYIYLIIPLVFIIAFFLPNGDIAEFTSIISLLSIITLAGCKQVIDKTVPRFLEGLKKKNINKKLSIIYISNIILNIKKNGIVITMFSMLGLIAEVVLMISTSNGKMINYGRLTFFMIIVLITIITIYIGFSNGTDKIENFKKLRILGYTKKEIEKIIKIETCITYALIISSPIYITLIFSGILLKYGFSLSFLSSYLLGYIGLYVVIVSIIYKFNKNLVRSKWEE